MKKLIISLSTILALVMCAFFSISSTYSETKSDVFSSGYYNLFMDGSNMRIESNNGSTLLDTLYKIRDKKLVLQNVFFTERSTVFGIDMEMLSSDMILMRKSTPLYEDQIYVFTRQKGEAYSNE